MATKLFLLLFTLFLSRPLFSLSKRCHPEDERILLQIKKEFNNPALLSSWKPHTDCCHFNWYGVGCSSLINERVGYLSISNDTNLSSHFPPSIGNLPYLETLFIYQLPNLIGPIPKSITNLTKLEYLSITETGVSGPIPEFSAQFKNLVNLDLSFNKLSGTLPPLLYQLPRLSGVLFNNNQLTGSIPSTYGYFNNSNLAALLLSHNKLSGKIPMSLGRLNSSSMIDLSHNRFEGDASFLFGSNKGALVIDISWNQFQFDFGKVVLPKALTILDVSHNKIYGKLPEGMENISLLNVSYNRLCGEIPKVGYLQTFNVSAYFHNKCLCGSPLPNCK